MKIPAKITGLLTAALIAVFMPAGSAMPQAIDSKSEMTGSPKPAGPDISGYWQVVNSTDRFNISFVDGTIHIEGWDGGTGEKFRISAVQWNGKSLSGIFVQPSKKRTAYATFLLIDPNTFKGAGGEVWKRQSTAAVSAPAGNAVPQQKADRVPPVVGNAPPQKTEAKPLAAGNAIPQKVETKPNETVSPKPAGPNISGDWRVVDSTARFTISFVNGVIHIEGWDSASGEKFRISDVQWNGKSLSGIFILPSKKRTIYTKCRLIDQNTLKSADGKIWKRQKSIAAPAPVGNTAPQQKAETKPLAAANPKKTEAKPYEDTSSVPAGPDISGDWQIVDSNARVTIFFVDGNIHMEGWDSASGEKFRISDVQWDGKRLKGIIVQPSNRRTTYASLMLIAPDMFKGARGEVWKRQHMATAPAPAGNTVPQQKFDRKPPAIQKADTKPTAAGSANPQKLDIPPNESTSSRADSPDISGDWQVVDSNARFTISFTNGSIHMEGWDSSSGEKFRISEVQWDGKRLNGIVVQPVAKRTSFPNLALIDPDTLKDPDGEVWKRQSTISPAPAGSTAPQTAAVKPPDTVAFKPAGQDISGDWQVVDSNARFTIFFVDGAIHIEGWDSGDGEKFRISNVQWDGKRLKGTFVMPSTNGTTYSDLLLVDPNTLKGAYKGDSSGVEVWKRH